MDFTKILEQIRQLIEDVLSWLWEAITYLPKLVFNNLLDALVAFVESIEVPAWLSNVDLFSAITPGMAFFMQGFAIPEGLAILGGALLLRFILRRIPLIG